MAATTSAPAEPIADMIPDPEVIRTRIDRCESEANLLRRLLRLAMRREREQKRLAGLLQAGGPGNAA